VAEQASGRVRDDVAGPFTIAPEKTGVRAALASGLTSLRGYASPDDPSRDPESSSDWASSGQTSSDGPGGRTESLRAAAARGAAARARFMAKYQPLAGMYVTIRGALVAMFAVFLFTCLIANWLNLTVLMGLGYLASCVAAPFFVRRRAQLHVVIAPPAIFLTALVITQILTAQGTGRHGRVLSVVEGTLLTLAALAPWLFAGTGLGAIAALTRGLRESVRDVMAEVRGDAGLSAAVSSAAQKMAAARKN
jgi:hypothetical protein